MIVFDITPMGKPRMTRNSAYLYTDYWKYKDQLISESKKCNYIIPASLENITFVIPFPKSYSNKKRELLLNQPHKLKPDLSNLIKGFEDCLCDNDSYIHTYNNIKKIWGIEGKIIIDN